MRHLELLPMDYNLYKEKVLTFDLQIFHDRFTKRTFTRNLAFAKVAMIKDEAVGFYVCKYTSNQNRILLHNIGVKEEYQNKGIGRILLKDAIKESKEMGFRLMNLLVASKNKIALDLYTSEGFVNSHKINMILELC